MKGRKKEKLRTERDNVKLKEEIKIK